MLSRTMAGSRVRGSGSDAPATSTEIGMLAVSQPGKISFTHAVSNGQYSIAVTVMHVDAETDASTE